MFYILTYLFLGFLVLSIAACLEHYTTETFKQTMPKRDFGILIPLLIFWPLVLIVLIVVLLINLIKCQEKIRSYDKFLYRLSKLFK